MSEDRHIWPEDMKVHTEKAGEPVDLTNEGRLVTGFCITDAYIKPDGDLEDKPSVIFLMHGPYGQKLITEISYRMLKPLVAQLAEIEHTKGDL